jgi:hypothetical protein
LPKLSSLTVKSGKNFLLRGKIRGERGKKKWSKLIGWLNKGKFLTDE